MGINKQAIFFTLTALMMLSLGVAIYTTSSAISYQKDQLIISQRVQSMNNFNHNIVSDAGNALHIAGFRALISALEHITLNAEYLDNTALALKEAMVNGTIDGEQSTFMTNNTLTYWQSQMQLQASKIGMDISVNLDNITIRQDDPWSVTIIADFIYTSQDVRGLARWDSSFQSSTTIPLDNFEDPMFIVETGNQYVRSINQSPYIGNFTTAKLKNHIEQGWYVAFANAPSYLMRLEGNFGSSPMGIESLVDKSQLALSMAIDKEKTSVDYIYFSSVNPAAYHFSGMPESFALDNRSTTLTHHQLYNMSSLVIT